MTRLLLATALLSLVTAGTVHAQSDDPVQVTDEVPQDQPAEAPVLTGRTAELPLLAAIAAEVQPAYGMADIALLDSRADSLPRQSRILERV